MTAGPWTFPTRIQVFFIAVFYTCFVVYGSLVPLDFRYLPFADALARFQNIPFLSLGIGSRADWVSNILLFIPLSYFWMAVLLDKQRSITRILVFGPVIILILSVFSVAIEFVQIWFPPRTVSLNDIAAEVIGAVLGLFLWGVMGTSLNEWLRSFDLKRTSQGKFDWFLQAYCIGFLIYSFLPFDLTISVTEVWHKFKQGKVILIPFSGFVIIPVGLYGYFRDFIAAIPVGMFVSTRRTNSSLRGARESLVWGGLFLCAVEFGQLFVYSRSSDITDIILGAGGVWAGRKLLGWMKAESVKERKAEKNGNPILWLLAAVYTGCLVVVFCYPFDIISDMAVIRERYIDFFRTPFTVLYYGSEFNAVSEILKKGLFFMPLGIISGLLYLKTQISDRLKPAFCLFLLSACIVPAAVIEGFQIFMPDKIADFTDILLYICGSWAGFFIITRFMKNGNRSET